MSSRCPEPSADLAPAAVVADERTFGQLGRQASVRRQTPTMGFSATTASNRSISSPQERPHQPSILSSVGDFVREYRLIVIVLWPCQECLRCVLTQEIARKWRPQRDSNPRFGLERATSLASGRWGRAAGTIKSTIEPAPQKPCHCTLRFGHDAPVTHRSVRRPGSRRRERLSLW